MDFKKFVNEEAESQGPVNGEPFMLVKSQATTPDKIKQKFFVLGIIQIINGSLLLLSNIAGIFAGSAITMFVAPGIWMGIFVIISGVFGILSKTKKSRGFIITYMILSILAAVFIWCVIGMAIPGILEDQYFYSYSHGYYFTNSAGMAFNALLLIFAFFEMVVAIVSSAFGCGLICCDSQPTQYIPVRMNMQTHNVVFGNLGSKVLVQDQQGFYQEVSAVPQHNAVIVPPTNVVIR